MVALAIACMLPLACSGGSSSTMAGPNGTEVAAGEVSPDFTTITPGETVRLEAVAVSPAGDTVDADFAWSSSDPSVATVDDRGATTGVAVGEARIVASSGDVADTAVVDVVEDTTPPAAFVEDFSTYASTSGLLNDVEGYYQESSDNHPTRIHLDTSVGVSIDGFDLSQSMRYDWPDRTDSSNRCSGYSIGRDLDYRESNVLGGRVTETWVEFYIRWPSDFTVQAPDSWSCNSASRLKTFFVQIFGARGRFGLTMGPGFYHFGLPADASQGSQEFTQDWNDGSWHRVRVEVILPNSPLASDGGEVRWWVDGTLAAEWTGVQTSADAIWSLRLGANMNQGPGQQQSNHYGRVSVWTSDPGW